MRAMRHRQSDARAISAYAVGFAFAAWLAPACSSSNDRDASTPRDAAMPIEMSTLRDGAMRIDMSTPRDAATPIDMSTDESRDEETIGPSGGTLSLDGLEVIVPEGALSEARVLSVTRTSDAPPRGLDAFSPLFRFEPAGTTFDAPVTIRIAFRGDVDRAAIWWTRPGSETDYEALATTVDGTTAEASVTHFSGGFAGAESEDPDPDAGEEPDAGPDAEPPVDAGDSDAGSDSDAASPTSNTTCGAAIPVTSGVPFVVDITSATTPVTPMCINGPAPDALVLWYSIDLPAGATLSVTPLGVSLYLGCTDPLVCSQPITVTSLTHYWFNDTGTPQPIAIAIGASGTFTATITPAPPPDTRPSGVAGTIACGASACSGATSVCCVSDGDCVATGAACGSTATRLRCDGPEDCAPGQGCCSDSSIGATCQPLDSCGVGSFGRGRFLCHNDADCPIATPYCASSSTSQYGSTPVLFCQRPCFNPGSTSSDIVCPTDTMVICEMPVDGRYDGPTC